MKKIISVFALLALIFSLSACKNNESKNLKENDDIITEQVENENESTLSKEFLYYVDNFDAYGVVRTVRLVEVPSTGYSWQYKIEDENIAVVEDDEYVENEAPEGMVGVGGMHTYRLAGVSEGETKITFKYFRSWEGETTAIKEVSFDLKVNKNNQILIVEKE